MVSFIPNLSCQDTSFLRIMIPNQQLQNEFLQIKTQRPTSFKNQLAWQLTQKTLVDIKAQLDGNVRAVDGFFDLRFPVITQRGAAIIPQIQNACHFKDAKVRHEAVFPFFVFMAVTDENAGN